MRKALILAASVALSFPSVAEATNSPIAAAWMDTRSPREPKHRSLYRLTLRDLEPVSSPASDTLARAKKPECYLLNLLRGDCTYQGDGGREKSRDTPSKPDRGGPCGAFIPQEGDVLAMGGEGPGKPEKPTPPEKPTHPEKPSKPERPDKPKPEKPSRPEKPNPCG